MKSYINSIGTAVPDITISQSQVVEFMAQVLNLDENKKHKMAALYRSTGIHQRHTVIQDYAREMNEYTFFPVSENLEPFPTISSRMELYREHASDLCVKAVRDCLKNNIDFDVKSITHLITVSCTGMYAPGIDIELVEKLQFNTDIQRTSINFMGCYAAFTALRTADNICKANEGANVLIVCVELCSLHFQKSNKEDHILANAIFSDGAAAVLVTGKPAKRGFSFGIEQMYSDLVLTGKNDMAWHIADFGFEMVLTSYIPDLVEKGIQQLTDKLLEKLPFKLADIKHFAIHPGGKKILEVIEKQLKITRENNRFAYETLKNYGNMSSPTVLFVLKKLFDSLIEEDNGKPVLSFAFGPGLTLESAVFNIHYTQDF